MNIQSNARRLLKDGVLLETTMSVAFEVANKFEFASRFAREFGLALMGQAIRFFDITGLKDRAYSHIGILADPGMGKDFCWKLVENSGIFPLDIVKVSRLDRVTEAALVGTISERQLLPPPVVTENIIFVGEFATLMRKSEAEAIGADLRVLLETGEYKRRLAKVAGLKDALFDLRLREHLLNQIKTCENMGMSLDLDKGEIHVRSTTSWIVSSARFRTGPAIGRSLLNMGDLDRFRWLSYLPSSEERQKIVAEIGALPPVSVNRSLIADVQEAWRLLFTGIRSSIANGSLHIPRDENSYYARKNIWEQTIREMKDLYPNLTEYHEHILVNLRMHAEFNRLLYQLAALRQFERSAGYDFSEPGTFKIDFKMDGEMVKKLWLFEYTPGLLDLVDDLLHRREKKHKRISLSEIGEKIVLDAFREDESKSREELVELIKEVGISVSTLDNVVLPRLIQKRQICRPKYNFYRRKEDCKTCKWTEICRARNHDVL